MTPLNFLKQVFCLFILILLLYLLFPQGTDNTRHLVEVTTDALRDLVVDIYVKPEANDTKVLVASDELIKVRPTFQFMKKEPLLTFCLYF